MKITRAKILPGLPKLTKILTATLVGDMIFDRRNHPSRYSESVLDLLSLA